LVKDVDKATAVVSDTVTYSVTLSNTDAITKTFLLTDALPGLSTYVPGSATGGLVHDLKGNRMTWTGDLGPTGAGIEMIESASPFGYVSLAGLGRMPFPLPPDKDDGAWLIDGLDFTYCGQHYTKTIWSINGTVEVGTDSASAASAANTRLPTADSINNLLAPWWTDLDLTSGGNWYLEPYTSGGQAWYVFEWEDVPRYGEPTSLATFQIWIGVGTDDIWFVYGPSGVTGVDGTVGAENADGTIGDTYYFDGTGTYPSFGVNLKVECRMSGAAPQAFSFQVQPVLPGTMILNEIEVSDGSTTHTAWAATEIQGDRPRRVYLPVIMRSSP
jgi:uncharacterized repeat protein (TIGR01451 family)